MADNFTDIIEKVSSDRDIMALILFGSRARGENYRDIDMCLFLKPHVARDVKLDYLTSLSGKYDVHIFHELPLYIKHRVLKDGKILVMKDFQALFDIFKATIQDYNLFEPHFKAYLGVGADGRSTN